MGRRKKTPPSRKTFIIICDGETEVWYFNMLKRNERHSKINIKPELPQKKKLDEQFNQIINIAESYTKVFWIVDFDTILKETKDTKKGKVSPLQKFSEYRKKLKKDYPNVVSIINSPCLEFWFLLHFEQSSKFYNNCKSAEKQLKVYIKNYEKSQKFFTKENQDIYLKLKPYLDTALENSQKLKEFDIENPYAALAEMHLFFLDKEFNK